MMVGAQKTIIAVLDDLFFQVKIAEAAKRADLRLVVVKTEEALFSKLEEQSCLAASRSQLPFIDPSN